MQPEIFRGSREPVKDMKPYSPPIEGRSATNFLRLDFNERTTPPHALVLEAVREYGEKGEFQTYPEYGDLDEVIANFAGVKPGEVIPTVGGDQAIDIVTRLLVKDGDNVIIPAPTFAMLEQSAHVQGANIISPRYKGSDLEFPFDEVMEAIRPGVKLVVVCNPNNPTGTPVPREQLEEIIEKAAEVNAGVLADEAYNDFAPELTVIDGINKYPNLFIVRSLSKNMGLSALRAGYVASSAENIAQLRKIRGPYDLSTVTALAIKTLRYPEVVADIKEYVSEVMTVSKPMLEDFYRRNGIKFFPSSAGFHLLEEPPGLIDFLKEEKNILVRRRPDPEGTVRVSIGKREDTKKYIEALQEYIQDLQVDK